MPCPSAAARLVAGATAVIVAVIATAALALAAPPAGARTAQVARPGQAAAPGRINLRLDLHDGTVVEYKGRYYMYGTEYRCGFTWEQPNTPFCGFGVAVASKLSGPWSATHLLLLRSTVVHANWGPDNGRNWQWICSGASGAGCFNPRMVQTPQGKWLLWFNAPADRARGGNPYWVLTCTGPESGCTAPHKPAIHGDCEGGGDFSIIPDGTSGYLLCAGGGRTLHTELLSSSWRDGTGRGSAGIERLAAEGEGAFQQPNGTWEVTYSDPFCGYCSGPPALKSPAPGVKEVRAGYATAPAPLGPWTDHGLLPPHGNIIPWCTGQPRTVFTVDGQPYEWMDRWTGAANEAAATETFVPIAHGWTCA